MITFEEYKKFIELEPNDKEFKLFNHRVYIYRGILIDYNYKLKDIPEDEEKPNFEELFNEGYVRMVGKKIDYIRPHITLDFDYQIQKYKDDIIKFIDSKV